MDRFQFEQFSAETLNTIHRLMQKKNADYAASDSPFANFEQSLEFGVDPLVGLFLRMGDKFQRLKAFTLNGQLEVENESVDDALKDIIGYAVIALGMLETERMWDELGCTQKIWGDNYDQYYGNEGDEVDDIMDCSSEPVDPFKREG